MRLGQGISFLSQWENSGGGRDGGDQRQVGVPVESGLGGPTQKSAPPLWHTWAWLYRVKQ